MKHLAVMSLAVAACTGAGDGAIVNPFTGEERRFVVDRIDLTYGEMRYEHAADLDGNGYPDNLIANLLNALQLVYGGARTEPNDVLAARAIAPSVIIQADDFGEDDLVGVTWLASESTATIEAAVPMGAQIVDGQVVTNRVASTRIANAGKADIDIPGMAHARSLRLPSVALQMTLRPDGQGGYDGSVQGLLDRATFDEALRLALTDQITYAPESSRPLWVYFDHELDGAYASGELNENSQYDALASPDIRKEGQWWMSFAFGVHLVACPSGWCDSDPQVIVDRCDDLVLDGDEVGIDCGGSCGRCGPGRTCMIDDDCQSGVCDGGTCTAPTCSDGLKNGLEADVDCGGACPTKCAADAACGYDFDCASGLCPVGANGRGTCT